MRLVRTQAKDTKKILLKAEAEIIKAIRTKNYIGLELRLEAILGLLPGKALELVRSLANYERQFTVRTLKKWTKSKVTQVSETRASDIVSEVKIATTLNRTPQTIENTYKQFTKSVIAKQLQVVRDTQVLGKDAVEAKSQVEAMTSGLFTYQNLALAGLAVIGVANAVRGEVAQTNGYSLEWSAILDGRTCSYCGEQDGTIYGSWYENEIPAHANCRCTWIVVQRDE